MKKTVLIIAVLCAAICMESCSPLNFYRESGTGNKKYKDGKDHSKKKKNVSAWGNPSESWN